jgi:hypothetical protein
MDGTELESPINESAVVKILLDCCKLAAQLCLSACHCR